MEVNPQTLRSCNPSAADRANGGQNAEPAWWPRSLAVYLIYLRLSPRWRFQLARLVI